MNFYEYGDKNKPSVLLVHGMGSNAEKAFSGVCKFLSRKYRVITVDLDGYDGKDTTFTTIYNQAEKIMKFLKRKYDGKLYACVGWSMGGFISMDMACRCHIKVEHFILDSGYVPSLLFPKVFSGLVAGGFMQIIGGNSSALISLCMRYLMGYAFKKEELCLSASWKTIYNSEYECMVWKIPGNLEILNSPSTVFLHGKKEKFIIKGAKILKVRLPKMKIVCTGNFGHGELMLTKPKKYAKLIMREMAEWV